MKLSFIILTWNSAAYVEKCLSSLKASVQSAGLSHEILVLDNGSTDGTGEILKRLAADDALHIRTYFEPKNLGTTRSRNILLREARGEYICVVDSDVEVPAGVFETLLPRLAENPRRGMVVPKIFYPSGAWQKSFDRFPTLGDKLHRFFRLRSIERNEARTVAHAVADFDVDYAISAFWLMRRSLLDEVGLLDERIFYAPEDVDFCLRVWQRGHSIRYVPTVSVVHHTQEISRGFKFNKAKIAHIEGLLYYFVKHRYFLRRPRFGA